MVCSIAVTGDGERGVTLIQSPFSVTIEPDDSLTISKKIDGGYETWGWHENEWSGIIVMPLPVVPETI